MKTINSIAVVYGSDSSESEVSCRSGEYTAACLDQGRFDVYEVYARFGKWKLVAYRKKNSMRVILPEGSQPEIDKTDFSVSLFSEKIKFDYAYILQHGSPGENGLIQGYFEILNIPFSTCSAFVSSLSFDKYACKAYLRGSDFVKLCPDAFIRKGDDIEAFTKKVNETLKYPVFVKPTMGGSSFGITRVTSPESLSEAIKYAFSEGDTVVVEQGVKGRELTCAVYKTYDGPQALPVIEIVTDNEYFDYDAKYNGHSKEICPAPVSEEEKLLLQNTSKKIYAFLGCKGLVRMDFILTDNGLYFLEVNITPGMTSASLVPKMVKTAGIEMTDFLNSVIDNS